MNVHKHARTHTVYLSFSLPSLFPPLCLSLSLSFPSPLSPASLFAHPSSFQTFHSFLPSPPSLTICQASPNSFLELLIFCSLCTGLLLSRSS